MAQLTKEQRTILRSAVFTKQCGQWQRSYAKLLKSLGITLKLDRGWRGNDWVQGMKIDTITGFHNKAAAKIRRAAFKKGNYTIKMDSLGCVHACYHPTVQKNIDALSVDQEKFVTKLRAAVVRLEERIALQGAFGKNDSVDALIESLVSTSV